LIGLAPHLKMGTTVPNGHPVLEKTQGFPVIDTGEIDALDTHGPRHFELGVQEIGPVAHPQRIIRNKKGRDAPFYQKLDAKISNGRGVKGTRAVVSWSPK